MCVCVYREQVINKLLTIIEVEWKLNIVLSTFLYENI